MAGLSPECIPTTLYVATTGSDTTGSGTQAAPWATVQKAIDTIRTNGWMESATTDITVLVGAGAYQDTNITIGPGDSGKSSTARLVIRQQDGNGTPELWGGHVQTGWMTHSGPVMKSAISGRVYTLYENGVRAVAAFFRFSIKRIRQPTQVVRAAQRDQRCLRFRDNFA
jgi:hypothetical protein